MNTLIVILIALVCYDHIDKLYLRNLNARQIYKLQDLLGKVRKMNLESPSEDEKRILEEMETSIHFSADVIDTMNVWLILSFKKRVDVKLMDPNFSDFMHTFMLKNLFSPGTISLYKEYRQIISETLHKRHYVLNIFGRRFINQAVGHLF